MTLRELSKELGVDASQLASAAYIHALIKSENWNQELEKDTESIIRAVIEKIKPRLDETKINGDLWEFPEWDEYLRSYAFGAGGGEEAEEAATAEEDVDDENDRCAENDDTDSPNHTVASLALELNIAEGRVINILRNCYDFTCDLASDSPIADSITSEILAYYDYCATDSVSQSFANFLAKRWNNPVVHKDTQHYRPGSNEKGKVFSIDSAKRIIRVEFEEISTFFGIHILRPRRFGTVSFEEWDWELDDSFNKLPEIGQSYKFLILANPGEDLTLSRRQLIPPPVPLGKEGVVISHHPEDKFICIRQPNGAYGFVEYKDLMPYDVADKEMVQVKRVKTIHTTIGKQTLDFAKFVIADENYEKRETYQYFVKGLDQTSWNEQETLHIDSWEDFVEHYEQDKLLCGKITEVNDGGYLLETLGDESFELFCPFSKSPTRIDRNVSAKLIGTTWLLKIISDPEGEGNNTTVSAKLSTQDYDGFLRVNGYYQALICSCSEKGAQILVDDKIPAFIPNNLIGWERDSNAKKQLQSGEVVTVKILSTEKNIIASIRDTYIDPWLRVGTVFPIGTVVETKVIYAAEGYFLVDLGKFTGSLPAGELTWMEFVNDCREYKLPEPLRVVVKGYNDEHRKVQVSLRELTCDPWSEPEKHLPEDNIVSAVITSINNSGAFLKAGDLGFKGYLSFRDVDWCRDINKTSFLHRTSDHITVKITHINKERRQLTCSLKALIPNPWEALKGEETVEGTIVSVSGNSASVRLAGGIECCCQEALKPEFEGQTLKFDILHFNAATQQIVISYRKQEIVNLNTLAVGEMFKEYRNLTETDKRLIEESGDEEQSDIYRNFIIKAVSSTGRVTAVYGEDDGEYENGILLPGSVTINGSPVNVIFARQIIKQHIKPGDTLEFKVTHRYEGFNYAVLAIDATTLLDLDNIATDDLKSLTSSNGVNAMVLHDICTSRNIFVQYNGYFGYIPRAETPEISDKIPTIRVKSTIAPKHPGQMIRFTPISEADLEADFQEQKIEKDVIEDLDQDLYDCYEEINGLSGFNPKLPDYYPFALQLRYNPEQHEELAELLVSDPTYFDSQTFFLDCFKAKGGNYILSIFNNKISISAFCREKEDGDEIEINKFSSDESEISRNRKQYGRPLRIAGENVQIVSLSSSAMPLAQQDTDLIMAFIKYNREVLPELKRLGRDGLQKRGEHYLTLQELLKMELKREELLCSKDVKVNGHMEELAGSLGGCGIAFKADPDAFESIMSKDDSSEGLQVILKPDDNEPFKDRQPSGVLKYLGSSLWIVELFANRDVDIDVINQLGLHIKRYPNIRHINKQIRAIDNFVYERNGLDIFSKIARNKLTPIEVPPIDSIEANNRFNLRDSSDSQANALKIALGGSQISLIQGPPGTGKSTVIVDVIRNLVKRHKKVLVCTQSVAPIEELYLKLSGRKDGKLVNEPVKIDGYPLRCAYLRDDESVEICGSVAEQRNALKDMMLLLKKLEDVNLTANGASIEELNMLRHTLGEHHKEECGEVSRKFAKHILPHCSDVMDILKEYHNALNKEDVENFASEHRSLNLEAVDVVFGTCIGVGVNPLLKELHFDTLIIDEAGKANYAESLVPMMMADEYVLVGDDRQLPPYTNSELVKQMAIKRLQDKEVEVGEENEVSQNLVSEIEDIMKNVGKSLFGDLRSRLPESNQIMLSKQFRMHPTIGDFVSKLFYDGKVVSATKPNDRMLNIPGLENPIKFIDTSGLGIEAREQRQGLSLYNDGEIRVIEERLLPMLESAIEAGKSIGILSPYGAQVTRMRQRFPKLKKHIFTIDSIQGEEYDIVVFSFVRNTRSGSLNFVDDLRRLNVSFSRAKCNLIMVGHLDTLKNEALHKVDKEAVMAVYDEILNNKIELVVHHGAMQLMYNDFPPKSHPLIENLEEPYHVFENCRIADDGKFTSFYKGKLLSLYNPVLKKIPKNKRPENFNARLIGYVDGKPHTMIEPMGYWLTLQTSATHFRFKAQIHDSTSSGLILELKDKSLISLSVPNSCRFSKGMLVEIEVIENKKFTIKTIDND